MNGIDIAFGVVIGLSMLFGIWRGFLKEVISLAAWLLAGFMILRYTSIVNEWLTFIDTPWLRQSTAVVCIIVVVLLCGVSLTALLRKIVAVTGMTWTDKLLGGIFGVGRAGVVLVIATFLVQLTPLSEHTLWQEATIPPVLATCLNEVSPMLPDDIVQVLVPVSNLAL